MSSYLYINILNISICPVKIEPGSQTEQAPPSAIFWLGPQDMHGFRFLTVSVAPRPVSIFTTCILSPVPL